MGNVKVLADPKMDIEIQDLHCCGSLAAFYFDFPHSQTPLVLGAENGHSVMWNSG